MHGDGQQSRDFTYVGTVVGVITDALVRGVTSDEPVNLAFGSRITLLELVDEIEKIIDRPVEREHVDSRPGDVRHSQADNSRLLALFPDVEPVPFVEGLRATVEWARSLDPASAD